MTGVQPNQSAVAPCDRVSDRHGAAGVALRDAARTGEGRAGPSINLVGLRMGHHAGRSGYDRLADYLDATVITCPSELGVSERVLGRALRTLARRSGSRWYRRRSVLTELRAARRWLHTRGGVFHVLYGENSYRYLGDLRRRTARHALVCTYHTPPWRFRELVGDPRPLKSLDAVVVVSSAQLEYFEGLVGGERVFHIPHGIDTEYYQPLAARERRGVFQCLTVGRHLRDFATVAQVARALAARPVEFLVVSHPNQRAAFAGLDNVRFLSGLADAALRGAYQRADALFLPLLDCTANNAILEALACGLPVISTDIAGVRDYVSPGCGRFVPLRDAEAAAGAVMELAGQDARAERAMREACRAQALAHAWPKVAAQLRALYGQLAGRCDEAGGA